MKQFWHFQRVNTKLNYTLFVRVYIKQYWNREILPNKTNFFSEFIKTVLTFFNSHYQTVLHTFFRVISHNTFSGSYHKIIPHIFSEFI